MCFQLWHNRDNPFFYNNQKGKHFLDTRPEATNESTAWETGNKSDLWLPYLTLREFSGHNTWRQKCNSLANSLSWRDSAEFPGRPAHLECSGQNTRREICTQNFRDLEGVLFKYEKGMATHSIVLAWRIPWTEELGGLQSMGLQRVGYNSVTDTHSSDILQSIE